MTSYNEKKILIVEDNELNQEIICAVIDEIQIPYDVANDGSEAIEKVKNNNYDLILTDLYMPDVDGITAILEIRKMEANNNNVPIIVLSAVDSQEIKKRAYYAGATDFIVKPIDFDYLKKLVLRYLK